MNRLRERLRMPLAITRKDITDALSNRMLIVGLMLPPFLSVIFTVVFASDYTDSGIKLAIYDPGQSALVEALREHPGLDVIDAASEAQIEETIEQEAAAGLVVPAGFDQALTQGEQPDLTLYLSRAESAGVRLRVRQMIEQALREQAGQTLPATIEVSDVGAPSSPMTAGNLPVKFFFMITLVVLAIVSVGLNTVPNMMIEEKERHTMDVILVSPASPADVVAGKALTGLLFIALDVLILIVLNQGWAGQWWLTLALLVLGMLMMVLGGLLLGIVFNRQVTLNMWGTVFLMILLLPTWFVGRGPDLLRAVAHGLPTFYLVDGLQQTVAGQATLASVGLDLAALLGVSVILARLVVWAQSRQEV